MKIDSKCNVEDAEVQTKPTQMFNNRELTTYEKNKKMIKVILDYRSGKERSQMKKIRDTRWDMCFWRGGKVMAGAITPRGTPRGKNCVISVFR